MMPSSGAAPPTFMTIALDLQIMICTFLHPADILALRKTCKALQLTTQQRIVWIDALRRVCLDNTLFHPSFPIPEMNNLELEQAAMAPRRSINLYAAMAKQQSTGFGPVPHGPRTRIIHDLSPEPRSSMTGIHTFLVPGGRYLVNHSSQKIGVWDLGYTPNAECKLLASVVSEADHYMVNATSDGMGLIIVAVRFLRHEDCFVYEIYPQSETPQLNQIAHIDFRPSRSPSTYLLPDKVVWYGLYRERIIFRIWDYRLNHSISFSADVSVKKFEYKLEAIATKTVIIVFTEDGILVWGIPPLSSPHPPDFLDDNPAYIPPLVRVPFPDDFVRKIGLVEWKVISTWYSDSSQPLYFDALCKDLNFYGFEVVVKPDLSDVSLHVKNTIKLSRYDYNNLIFQSYSICEAALVCWATDGDGCRIHIRSMSSPPNVTVTSENLIASNVLLSRSAYRLSSCPASSRFVCLDEMDNRKIVVVDFL